MPADSPEIGEVWELQTDNVAQAVISAVNPLHVRLVSRLRRLITVPRRSFDLMWTLRQPAPHHLCDHRTAPLPDGLLLEHPGYLQAQDASGTWGWYCEDHCPSPTPLFAGDSPQDRASPSLDHCPNCEVSTSHLESWGAQIAGFNINCCGACNHIWSMLIAHGSVDDGHLLAEQIIELANALQGLVFDVKAQIRNDTLRIINRAVGGTRSWAHGSRINGVQVEMVDKHAAGSGVVVLGRAVKDRQPFKFDPTFVPEVPLPRPGDVWFHRVSGRPHLVTGVRSGTIDLKDLPSMTPGDFARTFILKPFDLGFEVGAELVDAKERIWQVTEVDHYAWRVNLVGATETKWVEFNDIGDIGSQFRVIHRKSVYARLLAGDDPFKDSAAES